jgi:hypothetical protein
MKEWMDDLFETGWGRPVCYPIRKFRRGYTILIQVVRKAFLKALDDADPKIFGSCLSIFKVGEEGNRVIENDAVVRGYNSLTLT